MRIDTRITVRSTLTFTASILALALPACGPSQPDPKNVGFATPGENICQKNPDGTVKNPIKAGTYIGILRKAKCRQQKFLTMARLAETLGVECKYCHVADPMDEKKEIYPTMTDNKRTANWMLGTFIEGLKPADGSKMKCKSCHIGEDGKPTAKILMDPRDHAHAVEWMFGNMSKKFVEASSKKLECKTCHVGRRPGDSDFLIEVIEKLHFSSEGGLKRK